VYVYSGEGMDETTGMAAVGDWLAISGHFAGTTYTSHYYPYPRALTLTLRLNLSALR